MPDPSLIKEVENFIEQKQTTLSDAYKLIFDLAGLQVLLRLPPTFNLLGDDDIRQLFTLSKITGSG